MNHADRMKEYESCYQFTLPRKLPMIIRCDGRAFHTFTRDMETPYSDELRRVMAYTTEYLCENISGAKFGFTQSDEMSIVVKNDDNKATQPWFGNSLTKIVSLSASMATARFSCLIPDTWRAKIPHFDARCFVLPNDTEVENYLIWRQKDAERNSLLALCQSYFSHKELDGVNQQKQHQMLHDIGVNWNDVPTKHKRGVSIHKKNTWIIDFENPVFAQDREYIRSFIVGENK